MGQMSRRQFGALAAASLAFAQESDRKIGFCVVGVGRISEIFTRAVSASKLTRIAAVVSGHRDKAERYAQAHGIPAKAVYGYDNCEAIADNKDIDAVYIGLPNSMHAEYTIRAAKAGKHVLCEKPMANTVADCQAMIDACQKANKKLMIAYRCQYEHLVNLRAAEMIKSGQLGKIQTIDAASGFYMNPRPVVVQGVSTPEWRLDAKLAGGGPMMDMGIYALNGCRFLLGEEPTEVKGVSSVIDQDGRFKEVEENLNWTMKFASGAVANCSTSYGANLGTFFRVVGSKGMIHSEPAWAYAGLRLTARIQGEQPIEIANPEQHPAQFVREADHFAECILQNKEPHTPGAEGLRDVKWITEIYRSCGRKA